jgi:predicted transcriptional regulator
MSYQSEELVREVKGQRIKAALSQRALAARSGLTQAHISQIEAGRL